VAFSAQQQGNDAVVQRALAVEVDLADVLSALQETELGQRGFLLTGDASALAPYRSALLRIDRRLGDLEQAIGPIEEIQQPFRSLKTLVSRKQAEMAETLALDQAGHHDEAGALVSHGNDKRLMDEIRARIEAMDGRQDVVVARRETTVRRVTILTAASTTAAVILLGIVTLAALREVRRRGRLSRFLPPEIAPRLA
jgi:adenylate cyclase